MRLMTGWEVREDVELPPHLVKFTFGYHWVKEMEIKKENLAEISQLYIPEKHFSSIFFFHRKILQGNMNAVACLLKPSLRSSSENIFL